MARGLPGEPSSGTAVAASAVSIVSGWATSVVATDLIAGWWKSDRLFCIAVGFLALVFALATISGVILLLLRRSLGRQLIVAGAVIALLTYGGVFIAGARVAWMVHTLPLLPIASVVLTLNSRTRDWLLED
jgi:energy-converting hydrogenase Eha subunit B